MIFVYDFLICNLINEMNELSCVFGLLLLRGFCRRWVVLVVRNIVLSFVGLG